jgi:hypothetical protein
MTTKTATAKPPAPAAKNKDATVVFGDELERGNYLKTPKAFILIRGFADPLARKLKPRHIHLILVLGAKKYKKKMIRYYWSRLAADLGVGVDAARKTAYELRKWNLIRIHHFTGKSRLAAPPNKPYVTPGRRNDANGFELTGVLIDLITRAKAAKKAAREEAKQRYAAGDAA